MFIKKCLLLEKIKSELEKKTIFVFHFKNQMNDLFDDIGHTDIFSRLQNLPQPTTKQRPKKKLQHHKKAKFQSIQKGQKESQHTLHQKSSETNSCDSLTTGRCVKIERYPNTTLPDIDWGLFAAQRVLQSQANAGGSGLQPHNNLNVVFGNNQFTTVFAALQLEAVLTLLFLPECFMECLREILLSHDNLKKECFACAKFVQSVASRLKDNAILQRDLLIKKILFCADNQQVNCLFDIWHPSAGRSTKRCSESTQIEKWSETTMQSVNEPDLFGRAANLLVAKVLHSKSLRLFVDQAEKSECLAQIKITLRISWQEAVLNKTSKCKEENGDEVQKRKSLSSKPKQTDQSDQATITSEKKTTQVSTSVTPVREILRNNVKDTSNQYNVKDTSNQYNVRDTSNQYNFKSLMEPPVVIFDQETDNNATGCDYNTTNEEDVELF